MVPWAYPSQPPKQHLNRFSCFYRADKRDQRTDRHRHKELPCYSICSNRLLSLAVAAMQPEKLKPDKSRVWIWWKHSRSCSATWICMCGHTRDVVVYSKLYRSPFGGFETTGGLNLAIPVTLAIGFYNSLYYHTNRDSCKCNCKVEQE